MRRTRHLGGYLLQNGMFAPSLIKSIQRGTIALSLVTSNTATIASVNVAHTRLVYLGTRDLGAATTPDLVACRVALTNATTVTAFVNTAANVVVSFEVIQYVPGVIKSVQRGTLTTTTSATGTATITSVNTAKSKLDYLGFTTTWTATTHIGLVLGHVELTNATTVTFDGNASIDRTVGYQVAAFY